MLLQQVRYLWENFPSKKREANVIYHHNHSSLKIGLGETETKIYFILEILYICHHPMHLSSSGIKELNTPQWAQSPKKKQSEGVRFC